ncbi:MAG: acyl-ACP--UDP-N-acetylglucosamine O-acyltransferase [Phenylobacterium sp.]|uniref:acyl-ACP--UDP-N-acetylglucosamine O-acyltransferase n=1 Tax=Phenylobacterium sp. TaxID=1871053 RepID=UPI00391C6361
MQLAPNPVADPLIHPTAVIAPGAVIGEGTRIGPYAVIGAGVRLGRDNEVGPHVVIDGETVIGDRNRFHQACSIGAAPQHDAWRGGPAPLAMGDDNVVREFATVHGGVLAPTRVGSRNLIMTGAHVAHDCLVGDNVHMANAATLAGHVIVGDHAWISGLCAVHQHSRIGAYAFVAGGAIVTQDVPPFCLVQGDRARLVSLNTVGLKRAGFASRDLMALRRAFRALFAATSPLAERIAAVDAEAGEAGPVRELVDFLKAEGRGALTNLRRRASRAAA